MKERMGVLRDILYDLTGVQLQELDPDLNLFGARGGLNSVMAVQLIVRLEAEFAMEVPDEEIDLENFRTPRRIMEFLDRKLGPAELGIAEG